MHRIKYIYLFKIFFNNSGIDFTYILWFQILKYTFPSNYLLPIYDAFIGLFDKAINIFKIGKKETDIKTEVLLNNPNSIIDDNNQKKKNYINDIP